MNCAKRRWWNWRRSNGVRRPSSWCPGSLDRRRALSEQQRLDLHRVQRRRGVGLHPSGFIAVGRRAEGLARCGQERFFLYAHTKQLPTPCRAIKHNLALYGLAGAEKVRQRRSRKTRPAHRLGSVHRRGAHYSSRRGPRCDRAGRPFAHPAGYSDINTPPKLFAAYGATFGLVRSLLAGRRGGSRGQ